MSRTYRWALGILFALGAFSLVAEAREDRATSKDEKAVEVFKSTQKTTKRRMQKGPGIKYDDIIESGGEQMLDAKRDEAIQFLNQLIEATSDSDNEKPDLLFRLAEAYWEKSKAVQLRAMAKDDPIFDAEQAGDMGKAGQLKAARDQELAQSKQIRNDAARTYTNIIQNFPKYSKMDSVYFYLAFNLHEIGKTDTALELYRRLIKNYPHSVFVPDALLAFGEHYFYNNDMAMALKAYEKVAMYKDAKVYGFAMYKQAWCYYNLGEYQEALKRFEGVIKFADQPAGSKAKNRIQIQKEALKDLVLTYAHIGTSKSAQKYFLSIGGPKNYHDMLKRLAEVYSTQGKPRDSNFVYKILIKLDPRSTNTIAYQKEIVGNARTMDAKGETADEAKTLAALIRTAAGWGLQADKYKEIKSNAEELIRELATIYHKDAQKLQDKKLYAYAHEMYGEYVKTFEDSKDIYIMTFFYAELLYKLEKWGEAAKNYTWVVNQDPKGKYMKDAAYAAILAYKKLLGTSETQSGAKISHGKSFKPKDLTDAEKQMVEAIDLYVAKVASPTDSKIVDLRYRAAYMFYERNQFKEASERFAAIVEKHQGHELTVFSANLFLDCLNILEDFGTMDKYVRVFLKDSYLMQNEDLRRTLEALRESSAFKACNSYEAKKEWEGAADCYSNFAKEFPTSKNKTISRHNAALCYENAKRLDKAIQERIIVIQEDSTSEYADDALFNVAGNFHAVAVYSKAAELYEKYVEAFPKEKNAKDALANAAVFREGLGQYDQAIANYEKYVSLWGGKEKAKAAKLVYSVGKIYEKLNQDDKLMSQMNMFLSTWAKHAPVDSVLEAHVKIGRVYWKRGDKKNALREFETTVSLFKGKMKSVGPEGLAAGAEAKFMTGESIYAEFKENKLKMPYYGKGKKYVEKTQKALADSMQIKTDLLARAKGIYEEVISFKDANWAIAALARIGNLYQIFSAEGMKLPIPKELTEDQKDIYRDLLEQKFQPVEDKAVEGYSTCLKKSTEYTWYNKWSSMCEDELAKIRPGEYPTASELRAKPIYFSDALYFIEPLQEPVKR